MIRQALVLCILLSFMPEVGNAQEPIRNRLMAAHSEGSSVGIDDSAYSDQQRKRIYNLENLIMCACPKENWSKTLKGCPDGCADPQKNELRGWIVGGLTDDQVLQEMAQRYGPQVRAAPLLTGTGAWAYMFPFLTFGAATIVVFIVFAGWRRGARLRLEQRSQDLGVVTDDELAAIEKELEGLD
ncbi:MAG: cytochrome c-type biogenesis protein CcmH [Planctomycetota bacterium]